MSEIGNVIMSALDAMEGGKKWCVGQFEDKDGAMCATGAVNHALGLSNTRGIHQGNPRWEAAMTALAAHIPGSRLSARYSSLILSKQCDVADYNNTRRSFDQVREWFEKTALDEGVTL